MTSSHALASLSFLSLAALAGCSSPAAPVDAFVGGDAVVDAAMLDALALDAPATDAPALDAPADDAPAADAPADDAGPSLYTGAYIARDCGPADGFALSLLLFAAPIVADCSADPTQGSLRFYIHDLGGATLPPTPGSTVTSTTAASNGTAARCPGASPPCQVSEDWSVTFTTYSDTGGASGTYSVTWGDGSTSTGAFDATRCMTTPVVCG